MTIAFLALIVIIVAVGVGAISLRSRQPTSIDSGIRSFRREMDALAPHRPIVRRPESGSLEVIDPAPEADRTDDDRVS